MKFFKSNIPVSLAVLHLAYITNASLISSPLQLELMKREQQSQAHLQKRFLRGVGRNVMEGYGVGIGHTLAANTADLVWNKIMNLWNRRNKRHQNDNHLQQD
jgi:hypothetical protein